MKEFLKRITDIMMPSGTQIKINDTNLRFLYRWKYYFLPTYEKNNYEFFTKNITSKNPVIIDLGAHLGLFSILMAKHLSGACKIYSFEAAPQTFHYLTSHILINKLEKNIIPINKAVSDTNGEISFFISDNSGDNGNSISSYKKRNHKLNEVKVASTSLDLFINNENLSQLDFIKIDVEGAECKVVGGAKETIQKFRPLILLSIHPKAITNLNDDIETTFIFFKSIKYSIYLNDRKIESFQEIKTIEELYDLYLIP